MFGLNVIVKASLLFIFTRNPNLKIFLGFPFHQSGCCDSRLMFSFQDVKAKWGRKTCLKTFLVNKKARVLEIDQTKIAEENSCHPKIKPTLSYVLLYVE